MLRPFQVNLGQYLTLSHDIPPTAKVGELCSSIEFISGEKADHQVLLTADGRQMDPRDLIGNYSVGTDDKPIFVFYRSFLGADSEPPTFSSRIPKRGGLQKQLEILKQKPSPALFQHQVALAKNLCEHSLEIGRLCGLLSEEYDLQFSGWQTALNNCRTIVGMFQKHHQLFCKTVNSFRADKSRYLDLLKQFPQQVELLQQLPIPSSLQKSSTTLYDWISTHDEKNSLMDLSSECQKALAKVGSDRLEAALQSSGEISDSSNEMLDSQDNIFQSMRAKIHSEAEEVNEIMETIAALSKNIQMTSDKAFRSGDAKTIAILVESHHKSLQIILNHKTRLVAIANGVEDSKSALTRHIHDRLKKVMELQKKVADSNSQLVLLHEHIKLARKRFEILEQVCSTPQILVEVFSEVSRRRSYNATLEKVMDETSSCLRKARDEEKRLRKSFHSSHGLHFVTTLFPELQERVPDITFHAPKSLSKAVDDNLEAIQTLLPQDLRPSSHSATSVQLLSQLFPNSSAELSSSSQILCDGSSDSSTPMGGSFKLAKNHHQPSPLQDLRGESPSQSGDTADSSTEEADLEKLKELVGKLELSNMSLSSKLQQNHQNEEVLKAAITERDSAVHRLEEAEKSVLSLQQRLSDLEAGKESYEREKFLHSQHVEELELSKQELSEKMAHVSEDMQRLIQDNKEFSARYSQLAAERETVLSNVTELNNEIRKLEHEHNQSTSRLQQENKRLQNELDRAKKQQEIEIESLQTLLASSNSEKDQLVKCREESHSKEKVLESRLLEMQEQWMTQRQRLEDELARCKEEQKEILSKCSSASDELAKVRGELQMKEKSVSLCKAELDLSKKGQEGAKDKIKLLEEELSRQKQRSHQAQVTMNSNRAQMEAVENKRKELLAILDEKKAEVLSLAAELAQAKHVLMEKEKGLSVTKIKCDAELEEKWKMESEKALAAEQKAVQLENELNQKNPRITNLEEKLKAAEARVGELENVLSSKKELSLAADEKLQQTAQELLSAKSMLQEQARQLQKSREEKAKQKSELEHRNQEMLAKLEKSVEVKKVEWNGERDGYIKQVMELERELKELRREVGQSSPVLSTSPKSIRREPSSPVSSSSSVSVAGMVPSIPTSATLSAASPSLELLRKIVIHSPQVGNTALFMCDPYGNYLAVSVDEKTYYLNSDCAANLHDIASKMPQLNLKRKLLIGKITGRLYMEVRKENNRLRVPVGSRLYRIEAEEVTI